MTRLLLVTGTGTGVGKTVVTAAIAAVASSQGVGVAVVKPVQTGVTSSEPSDVAVVGRLTGCRSLHELVSLDEPLAPDTAARRAGVEVPDVRVLAEQVAQIASGHDLTLVEGAGGVLVRLDRDGGTLLTLGRHLTDLGHEPGVVVVTGLGLGTLNHTELTVDALRRAGFEPYGLVFGQVPVAPDQDLAVRCNVSDLPRVTGLPVLGRIPAGVGGWGQDEFVAGATQWLAGFHRFP